MNILKMRITTRYWLFSLKRSFLSCIDSLSMLNELWTISLVLILNVCLCVLCYVMLDRSSLIVSCASRFGDCFVNVWPNHACLCLMWRVAYLFEYWAEGIRNLDDTGSDSFLFVVFFLYFLWRPGGLMFVCTLLIQEQPIWPSVLTQIGRRFAVATTWKCDVMSPVIRPRWFHGDELEDHFHATLKFLAIYWGNAYQVPLFWYQSFFIRLFTSNTEWRMSNQKMGEFIAARSSARLEVLKKITYFLFKVGSFQFILPIITPFSYFQNRIILN